MKPTMKKGRRWTRHIFVLALTRPCTLSGKNRECEIFSWFNEGCRNKRSSFFKKWWWSLGDLNNENEKNISSNCPSLLLLPLGCIHISRKWFRKFITIINFAKLSGITHDARTYRFVVFCLAGSAILARIQCTWVEFCCAGRTSGFCSCLGSSGCSCCSYLNCCTITTDTGVCARAMVAFGIQKAQVWAVTETFVCAWMGVCGE